jgi:uncharacterized protein YlxW (UPF0749 family)
MNPMDLNPVPTDSQIDRQTDRMPRQDRRTWWATLFVLCALLGAMLGLSVKTQTAKQQQDKLDRLQGAEMLIKANAGLQHRIAQLQKDNAQLVNAAPSDTKQVKTLSEELRKAQFSAGLTDVKGPGVVITLNDSKQPFPTAQMPPGMAPPNIVHDTDINQVVNELKAAKAEAISVNDQRLIATSPVRCAGPTVFVNDTPQTPPYVIKAIGDPKVLMTALNLPGGIADQMRNIDKAMFKVEKSPKPIVIPAYSGGIEPKYAVPATTTVASGPDKKPGV